MGCSLSKIDTDLTRLCRERKDLSKASRDSLYSLAHAHMEYFQSLENVENAIRNFCGEALVICFNSPSDAGLSHQPVEDVPQAKDSSLESHDKTDVLTSTDHHQSACIAFGPDVSSESFSFQPEVAQFSQSGHFPQSNSGLFPRSRDFESLLNQNFFNDLPDCVTRSPDYTNHGAREVSIYNINNFWSDVGYNSVANRSHYGIGDFPLDNVMPYQTYSHVGCSSNPPSSNISDFVNPSNTGQDSFPSSYPQASYSTSCVIDNADLREIRKREGIPDLEDDVDDLVIGVSSDEECSVIDLEKIRVDGQGVKSKVDVHQHEESDIGGSDNGQNKIATGIENKDQETRSSLLGSDSVILEGNKKVATHEAQSTHEAQIESIQGEKLETVDRQPPSSQIDGTTIGSMRIVPVHNAGHLHKILCEIKDASDIIRIHAGDVSELLKQYEPSITLVKGASPKGKSVPELGMFRRRGYRKLEMVKGGLMECENETSSASRNLSLTLQKLYIWEKKLYEEVKGEEKLRQMFDREWLKLKDLDDRGAESFKTDARQLALQKLSPRIDMAISKADDIATRAYNITNDELQPQLCEFISSLHKLWKFSSESYKKHVQAITIAQANADITWMTCDSSLKATENLESVMLKLGTAFSNWVRSQEEFVSSLRKWLMKCQLQEQKDVNASCSSSSSVSMLPVLAICHSWHDAVKNVKNVDVIQAINNFTSVLRQIRKNLNEEKHQRLRFEYLSSSHDKQMKKYCEKNGVNWDQYASLLREADSIHCIEKDSPLGILYASLRPIRSTFHEARTKREEVVKHLHDVTSGVLQNGFVLVLEALEKFNVDMLKAYEQVKIATEGSSR